MSVVFFDFDGTLTKRDTLRPFARFVTKSYRNYHKLFLFYIYLIQYKLNLIDDKHLKESFLKMFIQSKSIDEVGKIVAMFIENILISMINSPVLKKLKDHIISGDKVYLTSANFDFLLNPLCKEWNLSGLISTETAVDGDYFTGKIVGPTCKGENKVNKIVSILGESVLENAIAYGDGEDACLLRRVRQGIKVS